MPKKKSESSPLVIILTRTGQILISIGSPPLFALKILLWTAIWIGDHTLRSAVVFFIITLKTVDTLLWFSRTLILSHHLLIHSTFQKLFSILKKSPRLHIRPINSAIYKKTVPHLRWFASHLLFRKKLSRINPRIVILIGFFPILIILALVPYQIYLALRNLPHPQALSSQQIPVTSKIYDRNGILLYQFYKEENRTPIAIDTLPKHVLDATIAIEDKNFYKHSGFDPAGIVRAAFANSSGSVTQGASTITQQLVRFALLSPEKTITRKIREIVLAFWAERLYTKNQILTMYLNHIPYGGQAYGIEAASQTFFKKPARYLTLAEAALIAGLPSAPTTYSPLGSHPELAKVRQQQVLDAMVEQGYISPFASENAKNAPLIFAPPVTEIKAPHFVMFVRDYLVEKYGPALVQKGGLQIITTLDYPLYESINKTLKSGVEKQKNLNVGNGAALVTNPKTGEILSMNGSIDFFDLQNDGNVNVTVSQRSPGSSIKPLNYALAFEKNFLTSSTIIEDRPSVFHSPGSKPFFPLNYDNRFHGRVTARVALASSYNIPAVKVLEKNGLINFIQFATNLGISTFSKPSKYGLSITLGGGEVKMTDLVTAYSIFPNEGLKVPLNPVLEIKDYKGTLLENRSTFNSKPSRLISPRSAFLINNILADDAARSPTFGLGSYLNIPNHIVSVKTGTTQDKRDNWTIGYSFGPNPRLAAVWVGNNDNSPMSPYLESGNTGAAAIWNPIMKELLKEIPNSPIPIPEDLIPVQICALTNTLPCENCPHIVSEFFTRGTQPTVSCQISKEEREKFHPSQP